MWWCRVTSDKVHFKKTLLHYTVINWFHPVRQCCCDSKLHTVNEGEGSGAVNIISSTDIGQKDRGGLWPRLQNRMIWFPACISHKIWAYVYLNSHVILMDLFFWSASLFQVPVFVLEQHGGSATDNTGEHRCWPSLMSLYPWFWNSSLTHSEFCVLIFVLLARSPLLKRQAAALNNTLMNI